MSAKQKRPHRAAWLTRATGQDAGAGANPPVYWHYTTVPVLPVIIAAGAVGISPSSSERPAAWFSANQTWEPAAAHVEERRDGTRRWVGREKTAQLWGLARIGCPARAARFLPWRAYEVESGMDARTSQSVRIGGLQLGARLSDWRMCFEPVPLAAWATIETWDEGRWLTDPDWPPLQAAAKAGDHTGVRAVVRAKACAALTYTTMPPIHHSIVTALLDQNRALATFLWAPPGVDFVPGSLPE